MAINRKKSENFSPVSVKEFLAVAGLIIIFIILLVVFKNEKIAVNSSRINECNEFCGEVGSRVKNGACECQNENGDWKTEFHF